MLENIKSMLFPLFYIFRCFHIIFIIFPTNIKCRPYKALTSWQALTPRSKPSSTFWFWSTWPRWPRGAWLLVPACSRKASHSLIRSRKHWRRRAIDLNSCIIDLFFIVFRYRLWVIWGSSSKQSLLFSSFLGRMVFIISQSKLSFLLIFYFWDDFLFQGNEL